MNGPFNKTVALAVLLACIASEVKAAPYLWWKVTVAGASVGSNGLVFDVWGEVGELELLFTFVHEDSDSGLWISQEFLDSVNVRVTQQGNVIPTVLSWESRRMVDSRQVQLSGAGERSLLEPNARFESTARIVRLGGERFTADEYRVAVDISSAIQHLRLENNDAWQGRHIESGEITLRVRQASTQSEERQLQLAEGRRALSKGDGAAARDHFLSALRIQSDLEARLGLGRAYLVLRQFREAAVQLEMVSQIVATERSPVHRLLAYAYVGIGDDTRAAGALARVMRPEEIPAEIERLRSEVRRTNGR